MKVEILTKDELRGQEKDYFWDRYGITMDDLEYIFLFSPSLLESKEDGVLAIGDYRLEKLIGYSYYKLLCRIVTFDGRTQGMVAAYS